MTPRIALYGQEIATLLIFAMLQFSPISRGVWGPKPGRDDTEIS